MTQLSPTLQAFIDRVTKKHSPNFVVKDKANKAGSYAIASFFARHIFNPRIDTDYATVLGSECWVPTKWFTEMSDMQMMEIIAHETLHQRDHAKFGSIPFTLLYALPQILAVFAAVSILAVWFGLGWLGFLAFLLLLLPLPAIGRMWLEIRAYRMNMLFIHFVHNYDSEYMAGFAKHFSSQFTGAGYYFMWPFEGHVINMLLDTAAWKNDPLFAETLQHLLREGFIHPARVEEASLLIQQATK